MSTGRKSMAPVSGTALMNRMPAVGISSVITSWSGLHALTAPAARRHIEIEKMGRMTDSLRVDIPNRRLRPYPARYHCIARGSVVAGANPQERAGEHEPGEASHGDQAQADRPAGGKPALVGGAHVFRLEPHLLARPGLLPASEQPHHGHGQQVASFILVDQLTFDLRDLGPHGATQGNPARVVQVEREPAADLGIHAPDRLPGVSSGPR